MTEKNSIKKKISLCGWHSPSWCRKINGDQPSEKRLAMMTTQQRNELQCQNRKLTGKKPTYWGCVFKTYRGCVFKIVLLLSWAKKSLSVVDIVSMNYIYFGDRVGNKNWVMKALCKGNCNPTPCLETRHFEKPRFPCFELQKSD